MKILVLGDTHGRTVWKDIIEREQPDKVIFLGDYVSSHEDISGAQQIANLKDILKYKEAHPETIMLRGNHDTQHLGYYWARCCAFDPAVSIALIEMRDLFINNTQWIHIEGDIIFSHGGISSVWMQQNGINNINDINSLPPSELFGFLPDNIFDTYGNSITQPPTWIRPEALARCAIQGYTQVIGHTPVNHIVNIKEAVKGKQNIWLCDCLPKEYMIIEDGRFKIEKV